MKNQNLNSPLPVKQSGQRGKIVPLDQAIKNPNSVLQTTPKTYLPPPANQLPKK